MRCVTWSKDSHGLFDYESRHISKKNIKSGQLGRIVRVDNEVEFVDENTNALDVFPNAQPVLSVVKENGKFIVKNDTVSSSENEEQMFVVVRNCKNQTQEQ